MNVPGGSWLTSSSGIYAVRVLANFILKWLPTFPITFKGIKLSMYPILAPPNLSSPSPYSRCANLPFVITTSDIAGDNRVKCAVVSFDTMESDFISVIDIF